MVRITITLEKGKVRITMYHSKKMTAKAQD